MDNLMSNNDGVTEMLPELYHAGKEHRLIQERIDALAPGSKEAALMIYRMRVDAVRKAIADLRDNQLRLKLEEPRREHRGDGGDAEQPVDRQLMDRKEQHRAKARAAIMKVIDELVPATDYMQAENAAGAEDRAERAQWGRDFGGRIEDLRQRRDYMMDAVDDLAGEIASLRDEVGQWTGKAARVLSGLDKMTDETFNTNHP